MFRCCRFDCKNHYIVLDGNVDADEDAADAAGDEVPYGANCMCEIHVCDVHIFDVANCFSHSIDQS